MKRRILVWLTTLVVAMTMVLGGSTIAASAGTATGELSWAYKPATEGWYGVTSPAVNGAYVYLVSYDTLYKVNGDTGKVVGTTALTGNVGYNKPAITVGDSKVFVTLGGAKVAVVDASSMELLKVVTYAEDQSNYQSITPISYDDTNKCIYAASWKGGNAGGTYAKIDLRDNYKVTKMTDSEKGFYWAGACTEGDYVVFGSNPDGTDGTTPATGDAKLYAYKKSDGTVKSITLTGSGSICSTVVKSGNKYYVVSKAGNLYEASIDADGAITASIKAALSGKSTCTPVISGDKAYIGSIASGVGKVDVVDLITGDKDNTYNAPSDVKNLIVSGEEIYVTYNKSPGGVYDVKAGRDYFTPPTEMQNYGISSIAVNSNGTFYYTNDSNYLMAVKPATATDKHKVTINAGAGGAVSPGVINTADGGSAAFSITCNEGYKVSEIKVNGKDETLNSNKYTSYTVKNIKADTNIDVSFAKIGEAKTANIEVSIQKESTFHVAHKKLSVKSTLAEDYGYDDKVVADKISALDALVAAHIDKYKTTDKTIINEKLTMKSGSPSKMVGLGSSTEYTGFAINEEYPLLSVGTGSTVNSAEVKGRDRVDFFWYEDDYWGDYVTTFTDGNNKVFNISAEAGKDFTVTLKGFMYMAGYAAHDYEPIEGAVLSLVDEDGNAVPLLNEEQNPVMTDKDGKALLNLPKVGTYYLTALTGEYDSRLVMPWSKITVKCVEHNFVDGICTKCEEAATTKTGDDSNIMLFVLIAVLALAAGTTVTVISRKRRI